MIKVQRQLRKIMIGIAGSCVLLLGLIMIPYPGPGWLVVFFGLTILATEFMWARGLLNNLRSKYDKWQLWLSSQSIGVKMLFWSLTTAAVVLTIWLFNGYGLINSWFNLGQDWLVSPFVQMDPTP